MVSSGDDRTLEIWDSETGSLVNTLPGHQLTVTSIDLSPNGTSLLSSSLDSTLRLWDVISGEEKVVFEAKSGAIYEAAFSPDGKTVAAVQDLGVEIWDLSTRLLRAKLPTDSVPVLSLSFCSG